MSEKWRDRSIASVEWSVRTGNALRDSGYRTLGELADVGDNALLIMVRNFGRRSLAEVRDVIRSIAGEEHSDDLTLEQRAELATGRLYAGAILKKAQAEAYERGRAEERADIVAWLRERASKMHIKACMSGGTYTMATLSTIQALTDAADELEARAKAPAERQDGGERE